MQLAIERGEKQELLKRVLTPVEPVVIQQEASPITMPRAVPWAVRRQILEKEDRKRAELLRDAPKPQSTEDLEKELGVTEERVK